MHRINEYRKRAADCRALAVMADPDHCGMIEFIAAMWDRLADEHGERRPALAPNSLDEGRLS